ncbi:hypothetical protein [Ureaplasma canigenitalium]|uniref:hypothetical protein n=1 Tax=Ureaplasma canigenitalium TaxID=42092 RepID=UPI0004E1132C|nr:hypothetical protein [Ureaplasma canigenitalium]
MEPVKNQLSERLSTIYNDIRKLLNVTFLEEKVNTSIKSDNELANQINKNISIIKNIEENYDVEKQMHLEYIKAFQSYRIFSYVENSLDDLDQITDVINSLRVYILNTYEVDVYENKKADITFVFDEATKMSMGFDEKEATVIKEDIINKPLDTDEQMQEEPQFDATNFGFTNNSDEFRQMQIDAIASNVFTQKVLNNEVYMFKTKPKLIPALKIFFVIVAGLTLILSIIAFSTFTEYTKNMYKIFTRQDNGEQIVASYHRTGQIPVSIIIFGIMFISTVISLVRTWRNDNTKYNFRIFMLFIFVGVVFISLFVDIFSGNLRWDQNNVIARFNEMKNDDVDARLRQPLLGDNDYDKMFGLIITYFVTQILIFVFVLLLILILITAKFLNPKRDTERLEALLEQIKNDVVQGKVNPNQYGQKKKSPFGDSFTF